MKVFSAVVLVIVSPIPLVLLTLAAVWTTSPGPTSILLLVLGAALLMLVPILTGAASASWESSFRTARGRARHRASYLTTAVLGAAGVLAVIASSLVGHIPPWIPIVAIAVEGIITLVAAYLGERLYRRSAGDATGESR